MARLLFLLVLVLVIIWGYRQWQQPTMRLNVGDSAPDFKLQNAQGTWQSLSDFKGQWVVLYFYPKDDTPGCTTEACHFRDDMQQINALGAQVVGVSVDTVKSHADFAQKHQLPFALLADSDGKVSAAYGALVDLVVFKMAKRYTFIIDPKGVIAAVYMDVRPQQHAQEVVADLKRLSAF